MSADLKTLIGEEWAAEGRALFGPGAPTPSREAIVSAAKRAWLTAARRAGLSITAIASECSTSRRAVRDTMKYVGCYQPPPPRPTNRLRGVPDIGQITDAAMGRREGCTTRAARNERIRRGLPRYRGKR